MLNSYIVYAYVGNNMYQLTDDLRFKHYNVERQHIWKDKELNEMLQLLESDSIKHNYKYSVYTLDGKYVGGNK